MNKNKIGYARVSTLDQSLEIQIEKLKKQGCIKIFSEKASGKNQDRNELKKMMEYLREQDILIVQKIDRLSRNMKEFINIMEYLEKKKIHFMSIDNQIDTSTPYGKLFFNIIAAFAEFEGNLISERIKDGLRHSKEKGVKLGRKKGISLKNIKKAKEAHKLINVDKYSINHTSNILNIPRTNIIRWIKIMNNENKI